jgi:hypothetical protein
MLLLQYLLESFDYSDKDLCIVVAVVASYIVVVRVVDVVVVVVVAAAAAVVVVVVELTNANRSKVNEFWNIEKRGQEEK